jgi:3'(2'), 5'-bisphosphate nucleotidase
MNQLHQSILSDLLPEVVKISKLAGETVQHYFENKPTHPEFLLQKSDKTPVTEADFASNEIIQNELYQLASDIPIISEESIVPDFAHRSKFPLLWIVDPLDGTKEFIQGNNEFAIHIGLASYGLPVLGVVYLPAFGTCYYATKKGGAYKETNGLVERIHCADLDLRKNNIRVSHSRSHMNKETEIYINSLNDPVLSAIGSSIKVMLIAEGKQDIYPKIGGTIMEWDTCAPQIILEEAGGMMVCTERGKPLEYNKENLQQPDFLAMGRLTSYFEY